MPDPNYYRGHPDPNAPMTTITSPSGVSFTVNTASAPYFQAFINAAEARGYDLSQGQGGTSGGYNYRTIAGSNRWSQHAFGNAIDLNQTGRNQVVGDYPGYLDELAAQYGLVSGTSFGDKGHFEWGGPSGKVSPTDQGGGSEGAGLSGIQFDSSDKNNPFDNPAPPDPGTKIAGKEWTTSPGDRRFLPSENDAYANSALNDLYNIDLSNQRTGDSSLSAGAAISQYVPDVQAWNPNVPQYSHPDDRAFPNLGDPNNLYAPSQFNSTTTYNNQPNQQFGPQDFFGGSNQFDIQSYIRDTGNFPAGSPSIGPEDGMLDNNASSTQGVGADRTSGMTDQYSPQSGDDFSMGSSLSGHTASPSRGPVQMVQGVGGGGQGPVSSPGTILFGVGGNSGNHYFSNNGGQTWSPIGQASQGVRWAPNSGTGNYTASMYTNSYQLSGQQPGAPNDARGVSDAGRTSFNPNFGTGFINDQGFIERRTAQPQWGNPQAGEGG